MDLLSAYDYARQEADNEDLPTENRIRYAEDSIALKCAMMIIETRFGTFDDEHWFWRKDWERS